MGELLRSAASLRVVGDDLDPDEVSALLGCRPTQAYRKGEAPHRRTGLWSLEADDAPASTLDQQVQAILARVTSDRAIWEALVARFRIDLFCGLFLNAANEGLTLAPATLRTLGERGIALGLDIYAPLP